MFKNLISKLSPSLIMNKNKHYRQYSIGNWTYGRPEIISWGDTTTMTIGRFVSIASGVKILLGGEHNIDWVTVYPFNIMLESANSFSGHPKSKGDVVIGNDVWIGREVLILSGVNIGNGAVIGARAIVTKDVAPYSVVAGNPARHIKFRFDESTINDLQSIAWWDWPIAKIEEALPLLLSSNIKKFIEKYK